MSYLKENFMLTNKTAEKLYYGYAKNMPVFDWHCHLSEKQILENRRFENIFDIWLSGDHYKWRLMRNCGTDEELITGGAPVKEKFRAYCRALETAFGNPLYHWSQVELKEFFGCETEINAANADKIWDYCNDYIEKNDVTPQKLIESSRVTHLFTTNEVFDDLSVFKKIEQKGYKFKVIPAFRADKIMNIEAASYRENISALEKLTFEISGMDKLEKAVEARLKEFIKAGTRAADIALEKVCPVAGRNQAEAALKKRLSGGRPTLRETEAFKGYMTYFLMRLYAKYGIVTELHIGAMRNNNKVMFERLGADTGYDSISAENSAAELKDLLDILNTENALPKTVLFNLNPKMNTEMITLTGCFQDGSARGKVQYGPAWWFLDNKEGMYKHLKDLSAMGHLGAFVGMLTDSRSFLSYPRHHYFRRILCSFLGSLMEDGEMTSDIELVGKTVEDISYNNAVEYFGLN